MLEQHGLKYVRVGVLLYYQCKTQILALVLKIGDFLFFNDISKYAFSFSLSRTVRLRTEPSFLLNFPL